AYLDLGVAVSNVGTVTQTCSVEEQAVPLILAQPAAPTGEAASIKLEAEGSYMIWDFASVLETRILPQEWPRLLYQTKSDSPRGTRRREVLVGVRDGAHTSSYRGDTDKNVPKGSPRIWRAAEERKVPEGTLD